MKKVLNNIKTYFLDINFSALGNSFEEVLFMTSLAFVPLAINICIAAIPQNSFISAFQEKLIPGEMLSYCSSFMAPSVYLIVKTHGTNYRLPLVKFFFLLTILVYIATVTLYLIAKNKWVSGINLEQHTFDLYFKLSLGFLMTSVFLRIYSIYHGSFSNWSSVRKNQQENFNASFTKGINKPQ
ncbi:hypothetical protein [Pedobacter cryoconitis]|uniref:hypothetical protein n=1 Tax=Pedobacter cryoconitis TaxID=188932 RepID=UPI0016093F64|nr:hypothetical protein [Pedobacter cryoconitis]MBB5647647.1 hypothetical protein [Pedobacter cryoconitis]